MMLHHMRVALAAVGWATTVERFPDGRDADLLAVLRMSPTTPTTTSRLLAAAMLQRRSDRRRFSSYPVPEHCFAPLATRAAREGVVLERLEVSSALAGAVRAAAEIHAGDDAYRAEIEGWSGSFREVDGVPARNVPRSSASDGWIVSRRFAAASLADTPGPGRDGETGPRDGETGPRDGDAARVPAVRHVERLLPSTVDPDGVDPPGREAPAAETAAAGGGHPRDGADTRDGASPRHGLNQPGPSPRQSLCMMRTGQCAWVAQTELTDPRNSPTNPPWPRLPSPSMYAPRLCSISSCAAGPWMTVWR